MNQMTLRQEGFVVAPQNFEQLWDMAVKCASSDFVPKEYRNKPENVIIAWQFGSEVGLAPMQSIQNICAINGRPSVWGDAALALVRNSGLMEYIKETDDGKTARCEVKRKGEEPVVQTFSTIDSLQASLAGKEIWKSYPRRMRQMRARSWALRDVFPDVLKGLQVREEMEDIPNVETIPQLSIEEKTQEVKTIEPPKELPNESQVITDKQLRRLCGLWRDTGVSEEDFRALYNNYGFIHKNLITQDKYDEIVRIVETWKK